ncbi:MAG: PadR family transcriptional regulator [Kaistella sp.]
MNTENTKAQMRKGILEFCILSLIDRKEMYVSDLIDELKKGKLDVVEGTLYPLLTRLKNGEFLAYRWEESTGGPPRKYYQITEKGKLFLAELLNTWKELTESVDQITKNNNPSDAPENSFQPNS